jgi:hypothetical protein
MRRGNAGNALRKVAVIFGLAVCASLGSASQVFAADDFSLQVTPSPLVTTAKPGKLTEVELKIRNASTKAEDLKIEPRSFTFGGKGIMGQDLSLNDTMPPTVSGWLSFSAPEFTVQPGAWYTQKVRLNVPADAGFSYSFALVISRKNNPAPTEGGRLIKGSLAVFSLVNIDRPGATRKLEVTNFVAGKRLYEYLPTKLEVQVKNTGNTIVQPYGNIFIQPRGPDKNANPLGILPVNETKGYILPGTTRNLTAQWIDGFPTYKAVSGAGGKEQNTLEWNWSQASKIRIGRYTAKLVAVYNDGVRDVPIEGQVSFWVVPWRILTCLLLIVIILFVGVWSIARKGGRMVKRSGLGDLRKK